MEFNPPEPKPQKVKWYYQTWTLIVAFLVIGPFALPLLWKNPQYSRFTKILWTFIIVGGTIYLTVVTGQLIQYLIKQIQQLM